MTATVREYRDVVERTGWGDGPWNAEPDKVQWIDAATGLDCIARRGGGGAWCGYVGVPERHKYFGSHYDDVDVDCHGGLTFADRCHAGAEETAICHVPFDGRSDKIWWLGFDCAHAGDLVPGHIAIAPVYRSLSRIFSDNEDLGGGDHYRTLDYVRDQCAKLAAQLAAVQ
jgi:hypothetical protein